MGAEVELKLAMAPAALLALRRHPLLRSLAGGRRLRRHQLVSSYYDTPDRRLAQAGMALRVRGDGRRFVQTLKAPLPDTAEGGLQRLLEIERPLAGEALELGLIEEPALAAFLAEPGVGDSLAPVFVTRFVRHTLLLKLLDSEIEVAFDQGEIAAGSLTEAIAEAEFELKSGQPVHLWQLALTLAESCDFHLERRSKAARGHDLAASRAAAPVMARRLELDDAMTAGEALAAVLRSALAQLDGNARAVLAGVTDPEAIHQLRVAVRRITAALSLFKPLMTEASHAWLLEAFRWLQGGLGPARDWDVLVLETLRPLGRRLPGEAGLEGLERAAEARRRTARDAAETLLRARRFTRLLLQLELWLEEGSWRRPAEPGALIPPAEEPVAVFAERLLARRARQLLKRGRKCDEADEEQLHALRIAGKKLRYALEFFRALLPRKQGRAALEALRSLQDCLGSLNDAAVGRRLLQETEGDARAVGIALGWQAGHIDRDLARLRAVWKQLRKALAPLKG